MHACGHCPPLKGRSPEVTFFADMKCQFSMSGCVLALTAVALLPFAAAAPLQWEQVQPVGEGPTARYSHGSSTCDAMQGAFFIFGGIPPPANSPLLPRPQRTDPKHAATSGHHIHPHIPRLPGPSAHNSSG